MNVEGKVCTRPKPYELLTQLNPFGMQVALDVVLCDLDGPAMRIIERKSEGHARIVSADMAESGRQ